jgi:hypothetical protein
MDRGDIGIGGAPLSSARTAPAGLEAGSLAMGARNGESEGVFFDAERERDGGRGLSKEAEV